MSFRLRAALFPLLLGACARNVPEHEAGPVGPNVIVILADDLGIGDVEPTNPACRIATPSLSRLAAEGLTFTDAHSPSSVCTPTRYGLLTGRYNWRSRLERGVLDGWSSPLVPPERATVAHLLRRHGYRTHMIGKWHLGWEWGRVDDEVDFSLPVRSGPDALGFETYYAHAASLDMPPYVWVDSGRVTALPDREEGVKREGDRYGWYREGPIGADFHIDEVLPHLFGKATEFVDDEADSPRPFFLYLALPAPHTPIVPVPPFRGASGLNPYADFVQQVDHHVGELLLALDRNDLAENTLVVFTSDNGCSPEANFELLRAAGHDPSAGFRGHKADLYEGGHRVPLILRWPGRVPAGRTTDQLACLTDVYPTLAEVVAPRAPSALSSNSVSVGGEDGFSWLPLFEGRASGRETLISHSVSGHFAIRRGPWKLLLAHGSGGWSAPNEKRAREAGQGPLQLYHLEEDPAETKNLADAEPAIVRELLERLELEVRSGTCRPESFEPGTTSNDREVHFLPKELAAPDRTSPR